MEQSESDDEKNRDRREESQAKIFPTKPGALFYR
jgi:hypothetical protein